MATNDIWSVEVYYQVLEEVLGLNLWYLESSPAEADRAGRELAEAYRTRFQEVDRTGIFPTDFRLYGVRVNNYTNQAANPYERNMREAADGAAIATTDLLHASVKFLGRTGEGLPVDASVQFSIIPLTAIVGNRITDEWAEALASWFFEMRILTGANEGQWIQCMRHKPQPDGSATPVVVEFHSVSTLVRTRLDRKSNTPNTGRSNGNGNGANAKSRKQEKAGIKAA